MIALGLMSGTSLDGIDAAVVELRPKGATYDLRLLDFATTPYDPELLALLNAILPPNPGTAGGFAAAHQSLGRAYADAAAAIAKGRPLDYVAMHGQTVYHDGMRAQTTQLGSPYVLRDRLHASVCFDFRSADCALDGQGAPLVPYVDSILLASPDEDRVAVNIGGIANVTYLPRGNDPAGVIAFDSGPGNMLLDAFVFACTHGSKRFDENGELAARGTLNGMALQAMLRDPYFAQAPPKSTGRERFGTHFLSEHAALLTELSAPDCAATLTALSAISVADAIKRVAPTGSRILLSGGGANNATLVRILKERLSGYPVETTAAMQIPSDAKEAIAFAVLGYETLRMRPANLPRVTGARGPAVLGAIVPYELDALLMRIRAECA